MSLRRLEIADFLFAAAFLWIMPAVTLLSMMDIVSGSKRSASSILAVSIALLNALIALFILERSLRLRAFFFFVISTRFFADLMLGTVSELLCFFINRIIITYRNSFCN